MASVGTSSDEDEDKIISHETTLESIARERKKRLLQLKSKIHGIELKEEDYKDENLETKKNKEGVKKFRNHEAQSKDVETTDIDLDIVVNTISDQLKDVLEEKPIETLDLKMLAPKKIDWDLKREIDGKLQKLERRTQRSIAEIIRKRLAEGKGDLATAVNNMQM